MKIWFVLVLNLALISLIFGAGIPLKLPEDTANYPDVALLLIYI